MKSGKIKITLFLAVLIVNLITGLSLFAQIPEKMSYQAIIRGADNNLKTSSTIGMQISILRGAPTGFEIYVETHNCSSNESGLICIEIGDGLPLIGSFTEIDWSSGPYFLKIETDPEGGTNYTISGTSQLLSVPYALHAKTADQYHESDPVFTESPLFDITQANIDSWNAKLGALIESDPLFMSHPVSQLSLVDLGNIEAAFSWGNHADAGYLTSFTEEDPVFKSHIAFSLTEDYLSKIDSSFSWGNHAMEGYLKSYTETDPIFNNHPSFLITEDDITEWRANFIWYTTNAYSYLTTTQFEEGMASEVSIRTAADNALQTELDASQIGAGLNANGSYAANNSANYVSSASSLKDADNKIDAQVKVNETNIASEILNRGTAVTAEATARTNADNALQNEMDVTQTGAGLNANGTYTADAATNYLTAASTLKDANKKLDTQVKTNEDNLAAEIANRKTSDTTEIDARTVADQALQSELDASKNGAGLNANGTYTADASTNYLTAASGLKDADKKLDAQIKINADNIAAELTNRGTAVSAESTARSNADNALQTELDASQNGAGLNANGTYTANASANYISAASSLKDADNKLDAQLKSNSNLLSTSAGSVTASKALIADASKNIEGVNNLTTTGYTSSSVIYLGNPGVDGTWRIVPDATGLKFECRESSNWVFKMRINK